MITKIIIDSGSINGSKKPMLYMLCPELTYMLFIYGGNSSIRLEVMGQIVRLPSQDFRRDLALKGPN